MSENPIHPVKIGSPYVPAGKVRSSRPGKPMDADQAVTPKRAEDFVQLSGGARLESKSQVPSVSPDDMQRYLQMLDEMPDVREEVVEDVLGRLARGSHGETALRATVDGLLEDLGLLEE